MQKINETVSAKSNKNNNDRNNTASSDDDHDENDEHDEEENNDIVDINLLISLFNALLYIDQNMAKYVIFNKNVDEISSYLQIKKQLIINKNESLLHFLNTEQLQLLKSSYYLQLSQVNLLRGYHYLFSLNDKENGKKYIDRALKICVKQYYGSKNGNKQFVEDVINRGQYHHYFCNFHTFDTYFVSENNLINYQLINMILHIL